MKKYDCKIILCGPAIGKTYLASIDDRFVDIDGMRAKYKYNLKDYDDLEKGKYNRGEAINHDSVDYAINLLNDTLNNGKIALISYQEEILNYVINNKLDYCLVYADISLREEYKSRMEKRGNVKEFVDAMTNEMTWKEFYEADKNDSRPKYKIKLLKGQYLSDIKDYFI